MNDFVGYDLKENHCVLSPEGEKLLMDISELVSMGLTVPVLVAAAVVFYMYGRASAQAIREKKCYTGPEWLALGIAIGFVGSFLDNLYWAIPWTLMALDMKDSAEWWMYHGAFPNIFFRQVATLSSAYCHIRAAWFYKKLLWPMHAVRFGLVAGVLFFLTLLFLWQR